MNCRVTTILATAFALACLTVPCALKAATFTVTSNQDQMPPQQGTLRWAIQQANASPGPDVIDFNIAMTAPVTIIIGAALPPLTDPAGVTIDGLSQPGASIGATPPSTLQLAIVLDGQIPTPPGTGKGLECPSDHNLIRGLVIQHFPEDGVLIAGTDDNVVEYCIIGLDYTGTARLGNGYSQASLYGGVRIEACNDDAERNIIRYNVISNNYAEGVAIWSCPPVYSHENTVEFNYIGTDLSGTVGHGNAVTGVYIGEGSYDNTVHGNLISGNGQNGVSIVGYGPVGANSRRNVVGNNTIGIDAQGNPLGNMRYGVSIGEYQTTVYGFACDNQVVDNTIAWNGSAGVVVAEDAATPFNADSNRISQNRMYYNGGLGIDLDMDGHTANDPGDPDIQANDDCNYPVANSATHQGGTTTISGTVLIMGPASQYTVEVFRAQCDSKGYGEGMTYLGMAMPDAAGAWTFQTGALAVGDSITATCTDHMGNTSEFSLTMEVVSGGTSVDLPAIADVPAVDVYPNPATGDYTIHCENAGELTVYGLTGREVYRCNISGPGAVVSVHRTANMPPGVYFVRFETETMVGTQSLVLL